MTGLAVVLENRQNILIECHNGLIGRNRGGRSLHSQCRHAGQQNESEKSLHTLLRVAGAVYDRTLFVEIGKCARSLDRAYRKRESISSRQRFEENGSPILFRRS